MDFYLNVIKTYNAVADLFGLLTLIVRYFGLRFLRPSGSDDPEDITVCGTEDGTKFRIATKMSQNP